MVPCYVPTSWYAMVCCYLPATYEEWYRTATGVVQVMGKGWMLALGTQGVVRYHTPAWHHTARPDPQPRHLHRMTRWVRHSTSPARPCRPHQARARRKRRTQHTGTWQHRRTRTRRAMHTPWPERTHSKPRQHRPTLPTSSKVQPVCNRRGCFSPRPSDRSSRRGTGEGQDDEATGSTHRRASPLPQPSHVSHMHYSHPAQPLHPTDYTAIPWALPATCRTCRMPLTATPAGDLTTGTKTKRVTRSR